jgi:two-component system response regulator QseB
MRLLYVEDDPHLGRATSEGLKEAFALDWFTTACDAEEALRHVAYDVAVLDINLPGQSGLDLLRQWRAKGKTLPVLLLTARDTIPERVEGLDAGADDYLVKPYDFEELLARLRALIRRRGNPFRDVLRYKDLSVDCQGHTVTKAGEAIAVTQREFDVLCILIEDQGRCLSKDHIAEKLYGWNDEVESNTIEVHVSSLRRKLGKEYIRTIRGLGYLMERAA